MTTDEKSIQSATTDAALLERVVAEGDLSKLSPEQRLTYYTRVCESLGLNPLTRPFEYIVLDGKLTLYARRDATDQLRRRDRISIEITHREYHPGDIYVVTARATTPDGRVDESTGVVPLRVRRYDKAAGKYVEVTLSGDELANALMKAETKAKRRVTLSICGLGWLDETETETVAGARTVNVDYNTGEILPDEVCEDCGQPVRPHTLKTGHTLTVEEIVTRARDRFGAVLCYQCARQRRVTETGHTTESSNGTDD